ncbi:hypothetical protein Tco_1568415 [Tanacetum coccineum]
MCSMNTARRGSTLLLDDEIALKDFRTREESASSHVAQLCTVRAISTGPTDDYHQSLMWDIRLCIKSEILGVKESRREVPLENGQEEIFVYTKANLRVERA